MSEKKKALLIGNNDYKYGSSLSGCVNDVVIMSEVLKTHTKGDPNFSVMDFNNLKNEMIEKEVKNLLKRECAYALFYFSGHGRITDDGGFICGTDSEKDANRGVSMKWLVDEINKSEIKEVTIILDCCFAGEIGNDPSQIKEFSTLRKGVTILAATTADDVAAEFGGKGVFTSLLYEGLNGAAADILGHVTPVGLYNCAETILNPWQQRPVFKSFVDQMTPLRYCLPVVRKRVIRMIGYPEFFPKKDTVINLSPEFLQNDFVYRENYLILTSFEKVGLLECPNRQTLIEATQNGGYCQLSPYGKYVWELVRQKRI